MLEITGRHTSTPKVFPGRQAANDFNNHQKTITSGRFNPRSFYRSRINSLLRAACPFSASDDAVIRGIRKGEVDTTGSEKGQETLSFIGKGDVLKFEYYLDQRYQKRYLKIENYWDYV